MYSTRERKKIQRKLASIGGYKTMAERLGKSVDAVKMVFSSADRYNKDVYDVAYTVIKEYNESVQKQKEGLMSQVS